MHIFSEKSLNNSRDFAFIINERMIYEECEKLAKLILRIMTNDLQKIRNKHSHYTLTHKVLYISTHNLHSINAVLILNFWFRRCMIF